MSPALARLLVLVSGAAILIVETLAIRLVAPYVGLTLESTTAAIGVALLGIAAGASAGGRLADLTTARGVVTGALVAGGLLVLAVRPLVRLVGPALPPGPISAVLLVAVSTLAPVVALAMVSPAVVRARLADLASTGTVVGSLSAYATVGSLAGTALTGFVLVALFPIGVVLAATGGACLLLALLTATRRRPAAVASTTAAALLVGAALVAFQGPCQVETTYFCARVQADPERATGRALYLDDLRHSYVDLADPEHLELLYTQRFADAVDAAFPTGKPLDAVHLGGGGFTMPRWLASTRSGSTSKVLELDPAVVELGREQLGVDDVPGVQVLTGDARTSLRRLPDDSADVVIGDAFGSRSVPWHLATRELAEDVRRVLRPDGVYVLNVIDWHPRDFLAAEVATLADTFDVVGVLAAPEQLRPGGGGNAVVVASDRPVDWAGVEALSGQRDHPADVAHGEELTEVVRDAEVLTDDFAPVDQLLTPYLYR